VRPRGGGTLGRAGFVVASHQNLTFSPRTPHLRPSPRHPRSARDALIKSALAAAFAPPAGAGAGADSGADGAVAALREHMAAAGPLPPGAAATAPGGGSGAAAALGGARGGSLEEQLARLVAAVEAGAERAVAKWRESRLPVLRQKDHLTWDRRVVWVGGGVLSAWRPGALVLQRGWRDTAPLLGPRASPAG
jgi:hypothetical protein